MKKYILICAFLYAQADFSTYLHSLKNKNEVDILSLTNPFENSNTSKLTLQALMFDKAKINGRWYRKNDFIDKDTQLKDILKEAVIIENNQGNFEINLKRKNHKILIH